MTAADGAAGPIAAAEFAALMAPFFPFETAPALAVAVSGGADSLALALLADGWARARGGRVAALTVDHRLRPEAAAEAAQVGRWLAGRGIPHHTLVREDAPVGGNVQGAARAVRYRLLEAWCEAAGVLHLLVAHHREDQAETLLLRLARGSGLEGLAGMAAVVERRACRVLRPLLPVPRARLAATLAALEQPWVEDPSNRDPAFARTRLREALPGLAAAGLTAARLAATAARLARTRVALEGEVAALLARAAALDPAGFARLDPAPLAGAPAEIGLRGLAALVVAVSGGDYPPRLERLERFHRELAAGSLRRRTLGGCRVLPRRGGVLICREPAAQAAPVAAPPGRTVRWDGRFTLTVPATAGAGFTLGALGDDAPRVRGEGRRDLPGAVCPTLPALRDAKGVVAVPHLGYDRNRAEPGAAPDWTLFYRPTRPLARAGFTVA